MVDENINNVELINDNDEVLQLNNKFNILHLEYIPSEINFL